MIDRFKQTCLARASARFVQWAQELLVPSLLRRRTFSVALIASLLAALYWGLMASDRYVSEAHVVVQRTDMTVGQSIDFASLISGGNSTNHADQMLLRDYLLSLDVLKNLDERLQLRNHYKDGRWDSFSRMNFTDDTLEEFHRYYLKRVSVEFDDYAGVLVIKAQGFEPTFAHALTTALVQEGENHMNAMAHRLAQEQVAFLDKQVADAGQRALKARQAVLKYQNQKGLVSPQGAAETLVGIVAKLEAELAELQTRRNAMLGYLMPESPKVVEINQQISAVERQIAQEKSRLAAPNGKTLNSTVEEYQRLVMAAEFADSVYKTSLVALEKGRVEATRLLKKVTVVQQPTLPEYSLEPRRLYNVIVFVLVALLVAGVVHLIAAVIRDHKD